MSIRFLRTALSGIVLACTGCVVAPPPYYGAYDAPPPPVAAPQQTAQNCREFQQTVLINGQPQPAYGTTCQQPDGSWRIADAPSVAASAPAVAAAPYPAYPPSPYYAPYPGYYYGPPVSLDFGFGFGGRRGRR